MEEFKIVGWKVSKRWSLLGLIVWWLAKANLIDNLFKTLPRKLTLPCYNIESWHSSVKKDSEDTRITNTQYVLKRIVLVEKFTHNALA